MCQLPSALCPVTAPYAAQVSSKPRQVEWDFTLRCTDISCRDSVATEVQVSSTVQGSQPSELERPLACVSQVLRQCTGRYRHPKESWLNCRLHIRFLNPQDPYQYSLGEGLSSAVVLGRPWVREVLVAGSEPRPLAECWSSMNSLSRFTSALQSEQTWRIFVTSSHAQKVSFLHSMLRKAPRSVFVILLLLSLDAVAQQWSSMEWSTRRSHHLPQPPPPSWSPACGMERSWSKGVSSRLGRWVGSVRAPPRPF